MESSRAAEACLLIRSTALLVSPDAHDGDALRRFASGGAIAWMISGLPPWISSAQLQLVRTMYQLSLPAASW